MRQRVELVERSFAHILDRGGMRRTWLRGRENVHKRYLIHVAGHNLGLLMRLLIGAGTPKEAVASGWCFLVLLPTGNGAYEALIMVLVANRAMPALIVFRMAFDPPPGRNNHFVNGLLGDAAAGSQSAGEGRSAAQGYGLLWALADRSGSGAAALRARAPRQPRDHHLLGLGRSQIGERRQARMGAGVGQRHLARQPSGAGVDQDA